MGLKWFPLCDLFCAAAEIASSQPVNIPDLAKRKKKKRTRATDSFTGTFDGNVEVIMVEKMQCVQNVYVLFAFTT